MKNVKHNDMKTTANPTINPDNAENKNSILTPYLK